MDPTPRSTDAEMGSGRITGFDVACPLARTTGSSHVNRHGCTLERTPVRFRGGTDMSFEFNEDAIRDLANRAVTIRAQEMQALLDEVRTTAPTRW